MSIAAISSSFVAAVRERTAVASVDAVAAPRAAAQGHREAGRRHELVDAMSQVLGLEGEQEHSDEQAVFRFAHALMHDLRSMELGGAAEGEPKAHGRGHAWGRREWNDLPQRIDALATAAAANTATPPVDAAAEAPAAAEPADAALSTLPVAPEPEPAPEPLPEMPPPNPLTATSAALHLMQVPSSRLLEAYAALREALGAQPSAAPAESGGDDLATFLAHLSDELAPDAPAALPAGSVLNLTA
jgi:hypothetical protein